MNKKLAVIFLFLSFITISSKGFCEGTNIQSYQEEVIELSKNDAFSNSYQDTNKISTTAGLSLVEQLFNGKDADLSSNILRQIGYDVFNAPSSIGANSTGKFDNSYRLSIGEKVSIYLYGDSVDVMAISGSNLLSPNIKTEVDSKGNLFIQGLGVVPAENRTISEVESSINSIASKKYKNLNVRLSISSGQDFSVFVYGQVNKPGKVLVGNNSSLIDALGAAGGVKKTGTLRKIVYTSGAKTREIDLYKAIFSGLDDDIILRPNDKIFVGGIGNVVALKNGVTVPGIYEVKDVDTLTSVITYAGGLLPGTQTTEVTLTALDPTTQERSASNLSWIEAKNTKLKSGDTVEFRELYNTAENTVTLQGNIKHPATYAYKEGMRLSDILKSENELLEETFITQAVIRRVSGDNNTVETIPVFLKEFFAGMNDPVLKPRDVINIYKNTNSEFVDVYGCINKPKHITYTANMMLDDVLTDVQFIDSNVEATDDENNEEEINAEKLNEDGNEQEIAIKEGVETTALIGATASNNRIISAENVAVEIIGPNGATQVYYLYDIMINSNTIKTIPLMPFDKVFFRTLRENETIKNVKVSGFVKKPTSYKFIEGKRLTDMIEMAGGLTKDADLRGIVYLRKNVQSRQVNLAQKNNERDIQLLEGRLASGYKQEKDDITAKTDMITMLKNEVPSLQTKYNGQIALNITSNDLSEINDIDNIEVQDGDEIYIPRISNHVSVIGEVYNEQSFMYKKGATVKSYIKEVGGYTPNANKFRIYKVSVNGRAEKVKMCSAVTPGDTIVVPRKIAGNDWLTPICDALKGIASILTTGFIVTRW